MMAHSKTVSMLGLFCKVVLMVQGDMASGAGIYGHGMGSGAKDSARETFERLIDPPEDIGLCWGDG